MLLIDKYDISCDMRGRIQHSDCKAQYIQHILSQSDCRYLVIFAVKSFKTIYIAVVEVGLLAPFALAAKWNPIQWKKWWKIDRILSNFDSYQIHHQFFKLELHT